MSQEVLIYETVDKNKCRDPVVVNGQVKHQVSFKHESLIKTTLKIKFSTTFGISKPKPTTLAIQNASTHILKK